MTFNRQPFLKHNLAGVRFFKTKLCLFNIDGY